MDRSLDLSFYRSKVCRVDKVPANCRFDSVQRKNLSYDLNFKYPTSNNSVLAPFRKTFEMACAGPLTEITVGRKSSEVESEQERLILPESSLVLKF